MRVVKRTKQGLFVLAAASMGATLIAPETFASNIYNIEYTGGVPLSEANVQIEPEMLGGLTPLITRVEEKGTITDVKGFSEGYYKGDNVCHKYYYLRAQSDSTTQNGDAPYYVVSNAGYTAVVRFDKVFLENNSTQANPDQAVSVGVHSVNKYPYVSGGTRVYADETCETVDDTVRLIDRENNEKLFAQVNVKLYDTKTGDPFTSDKLYIDITDIDAAQSYKILNTGNELAAGKMYSKSASTLQPESSDGTGGSNSGLQNMFVSNNGYIYSEYDGLDSITTNEANNIFVKLNKQTQDDGLNFVFGFAAAAGSGIEYYAQKYSVEYLSDENGTLAEKTEDVFSGNNPSGAVTTPNDGYELAYWTADVDVTLDDGTVIKAGDEIAIAQLSKVTVEQDTVFTAVHEKAVAVPDTGASTGEMNAAYIAAPIAGILAVALIAKLAPRVMRKKIGFD